MKKTTLTVLAFLLAKTLFGQWEIVGGSDSYFTPNPGYGNGQSHSSIQNLQFHPITNEPYVFFRHHTTNVAVGPSLVKFNGTDWEFISTQFDGPGSGNTSSADFFWGFYFRQDTNVPVVFYQDSYFEGGTQYKYHVAEYVGSTWTEIMGIDNSVVDDVFFGGHRTRMVRNPISNMPVIVGNGPTQIPVGSKTIVSHFDADMWGHLGDETFGAFGAYVSDIDYHNSTSIPYVITTFTDASIRSEVWYFQGSWQSLGDPGFEPVNYGEGFRIRVNQSNGDIYVLCPEGYDNPNNSQTMTLTIKKWDGNNWVTLGTPEEIWVGSALGYDLEIHPATGEPYVCFIDGGATYFGINIKRWDGQNWISTNEPNLPGTFGEKVDLVFQPQTYTPYVVSTTGQLLRSIEATASIDQYILKPITLYPNPASDIVSFSDKIIKYVEVFDINGRKMLSNNSNSISVKTLPKGIYIIKGATSKNISVTKRLIKI